MGAAVGALVAPRPVVTRPATDQVVAEAGLDLVVPVSAYAHFHGLVTLEVVGQLSWL